MSSDLLGVLLVVVSCVAGLLLIPFGLPGLWVMVLGILGYGWLTDFRSMGSGLVVLILALALAGEVIEGWLGFRLARRYGGSSRAGWGALAGGLVGAIVGVPIPVVGSVIGGLVGAFLGAALFEYTKARHSKGAVRAGYGAMLGRAAAAAAKMAIGIVIAVLGAYMVFRR